MAPEQLHGQARRRPISTRSARPSSRSPGASSPRTSAQGPADRPRGQRCHRADCEMSSWPCCSPTRRAGSGRSRRCARPWARPTRPPPRPRSILRRRRSAPRAGARLPGAAPAADLPALLRVAVGADGDRACSWWSSSSGCRWCTRCGGQGRRYRKAPPVRRLQAREADMLSSVQRNHRRLQAIASDSDPRERPALPPGTG